MEQPNQTKVENDSPDAEARRAAKRRVGAFYIKLGLEQDKDANNDNPIRDAIENARSKSPDING